MKIRGMKFKDIKSLIEIATDTDIAEKKESKYDFYFSLKKIKMNPYRFEKFYVAEEKGKVIGVIGFQSFKWEPKSSVNLDWFAVDPEYQHRGIGML